MAGACGGEALRDRCIRSYHWTIVRGSNGRRRVTMRELRVLLVHALTPKRRRLARVLRTAGHDVSEASSSGEALADIAAGAPDVALIHADYSDELLPAIKSDPVAYATAVLLIERPGLDPARAIEGMRSG